MSVKITRPHAIGFLIHLGKIKKYTNEELEVMLSKLKSEGWQLREHPTARKRYEDIMVALHNDHKVIVTDDKVRPNGAKTVKISQKDALSLFVALGFKTADKWTPVRLKEKLNKLNTIVDEDTKVPGEASALLKKVVAALNKGTEIELTADTEDDDDEDEKPAKKKGAKAAPKKSKKKEEDDDDEAGEDDNDEEDSDEASEDEDEDEDEDSDSDEDDDDEPAPKKKVKKPVKAAKKSKKKPADEDDDDEDDDDEDDDDEDDDDEDDDDEDDDDDEKPKKKVKKGDKPKKKGIVKVGIISTIVDVLKTGTAKKPVTKEKILKVLVKKFPDRESSSMKSTINHQVPTNLRGRGYKLKKNDSGFWIPSDEPDEDDDD